MRNGNDNLNGEEEIKLKQEFSFNTNFQMKV